VQDRASLGPRSPSDSVERHFSSGPNSPAPCATFNTIEVAARYDTRDFGWALSRRGRYAARRAD
jgi:hypothetical protein